MPSKNIIERQIENAIMASLDSIGYPNALAIRNVRFNQYSGRADLMLLPEDGPKKLVLIEVKQLNNKESIDKVVGQLLKYYTAAVKLGSEAIEQFRTYAATNVELARGNKVTTPHRVYGGILGSQIWPNLSNGDRLRPDEIELMIALNGQPGLILKDIVGVLSDLHQLPIRLIAVENGRVRFVPTALP